MRNLEELAPLLIDQRKKLGLEQKDMYMRIGMKQQQYQRLEAGNDVKLSTLLRVLEGLDLELAVTPKETKNPLREKGQCDALPDDLRDDTDDLDFWFSLEDKG
ncbi:helix-turn-helix domain-containing protein [Vibrio parahaemolyticus]|nr:helix-turn-helix domain-containing protein [Vibrio parahaemolyticus]